MTKLEHVAESLAFVEKLLTGVRSTLLAESEAAKKPLRQSSEFALVAVQADYESAAALVAELKAAGEKAPQFASRSGAAAKNAAFLLERVAALILSLSIEEPLFRSYERVGENLAALARSGAALREAGAGAGATEEIMSALGIH